MRDNPTSDLYPQDGNSLAVWFGLVDTQQRTQDILRRLISQWNSYGAVTPEWNGISPFAGSMEVMALFQAGDDNDALTLIRREWGYMLQAPFGTGSTFWEGMSTQGKLVYGGPYESLAHGWSTGPTSALTFYVAGLQPDADGGRSYTVMPHPGDLQQVQASLLMSPGRRVTDSWQRTPHGFDLQLDSTKDPHSMGVVAIPTFGADVTVQINGNTVTPTHETNSYVYLPALGPGHYHIITTAK
jgi:hypothetical protein